MNQRTSDSYARRESGMRVALAYRAVLLTLLVAWGIHVGSERAHAQAPMPFREHGLEGAPSNSGRVWLCDLREEHASVGWGVYGKNGQGGFTEHHVCLRELYSPKGIGLAAPAHAEYALGRRFATFRGTAAINQSAGAGSQRPIIFQVWGDGRLLWESRGMHGHPDCQPCCVDIRSVDRLVLEVQFRPGAQGHGYKAHSVWIDPYVDAVPTENETLNLFDSRPFREAEEVFKFTKHLRELLLQEDFNGLEAKAKEAREKPLLWSGVPRIAHFYQALREPEDTTDAQWAASMRRLLKWREKHPQSPSARIALAWLLIEQGWHLRGTDVAARTPADALAKFDDCLRTAWTYLEEADALGAADPEINVARLVIAKGRGMQRARAAETFRQATAAHPHYWRLYEAWANYLLPQWMGEPGALEAEAERLRNELPQELGAVAYARMALELLPFRREEFFRTTKFLYPKLRPGLVALLRDNPADDFLVNQACQLACIAGDRELAGPLLTRLDMATFNATVWGGYQRFQHWRRKFQKDALRDDAYLTLTTPDGVVRGVAFTDRGRKLLTAGEGELVTIWDVQTGAMERRIPSPSFIRAIAMRPRHVQVATSSNYDDDAKATLYLLDLATPPAPWRELEGHANVISSLSFSPDGEWLATGSHDKIVRLSRMQGETPALVLRHPEWVFAVQYSPDGKWLATSSYQGGLWLWDSSTGKPIGQPLVEAGKGPWMCQLGFAERGKILLTGSVDGTLRRWDLQRRDFLEKKAEGKYVSPGDYLHAFALSPDERTLAIGRGNGRIELRSPVTFALQHTLVGHVGPVRALTFSPDATVVASGSDDAGTKLWKLPALTP